MGGNTQEQATNDAPLVTAVVATYNEEKHVRACLEGILNQTGLNGAIEILVVDGDSTDATTRVAQSLTQYGSTIRVLRNSRRFQVYAWNIGIREARGRFVALFSAHTEYGADYLAQCMAVQARTGAANVGGVQVPVGDNALGKVIAWAMQSPFGIGNARGRYAKREQFVDSVFGAFFEKRLIQELGGYDESIPFNEDAELNYRLWEAGHTVFLSPSIKVVYHVRSSLRALAKQMFRYGYWRRRTQLEHPRRVPLRTFVPGLFLAGLIASLAVFGVTREIWAMVIPTAYAGFLLVAALSAGFSQRSLYAFLVGPSVLAVMHFTYGAGWLIGLLVHRQRGRWGKDRAQSAAISSV